MAVHNFLLLLGLNIIIFLPEPPFSTSFEFALPIQSDPPLWLSFYGALVALIPPFASVVSWKDGCVSYNFSPNQEVQHLHARHFLHQCLRNLLHEIQELNKVGLQKPHGLQVGAPTCVGLVAPIDVVVPLSNTGLDPSQTSFFQVLNISIKINKATDYYFPQADKVKEYLADPTKFAASFVAALAEASGGAATAHPPAKREEGRQGRF